MPLGVELDGEDGRAGVLHRHDGAVLAGAPLPSGRRKVGGKMRRGRGSAHGSAGLDPEKKDRVGLHRRVEGLCRAFRRLELGRAGRHGPSANGLKAEADAKSGRPRASASLIVPVQRKSEGPAGAGGHHQRWVRSGRGLPRPRGADRWTTSSPVRAGSAEGVDEGTSWSRGAPCVPPPAAASAARFSATDTLRGWRRAWRRPWDRLALLLVGIGIGRGPSRPPAPPRCRPGCGRCAGSARVEVAVEEDEAKAQHTRRAGSSRSLDELIARASARRSRSPPRRGEEASAASRPGRGCPSMWSTVWISREYISICRLPRTRPIRARTRGLVVAGRRRRHNGALVPRPCGC